MIVILFLVNRFGISVPLTFLGAYLGFKKKVLSGTIILSVDKFNNLLRGS